MIGQPNQQSLLVINVHKQTIQKYVHIVYQVLDLVGGS